MPIESRLESIVNYVPPLAITGLSAIPTYSSFQDLNTGVAVAALAFYGAAVSTKKVWNNANRKESSAHLALYLAALAIGIHKVYQYTLNRPL